MAKDKQVPNGIADALDAEADSIDVATLDKLRQARQKALDQESGRPILDWLPAGHIVATTGAITVTTAVVMLAFWISVVNPQTRVNTIEDIELLASADNAELYENIEFYEWLESQQQSKVNAG